MTRRLKQLLALVLAVGLLVLGALLPRAAGAVLDRKTQGRLQYAQIGAVELNVQAAREALPILSKLRLLASSGYFLPYPVDRAAMTEEEVRKAAIEALAPYIKAELICCDVSLLDFGCEPKVIYSDISPEEYNIYWDVWFYGSVDDVYHNVSLTLDDETGMLVLIDYNHNPTGDNYGGEEVYQPEKAQIFAELFFDGLGEGLLGEFLGCEDTGYSLLWRWGDAKDGEYCIEFCAHGNDTSGAFYLHVYRSADPVSAENDSPLMQP